MAAGLGLSSAVAVAYSVGLWLAAVGGTILVVAAWVWAAPLLRPQGE